MKLGMWEKRNIRRTLWTCLGRHSAHGRKVTWRVEPRDMGGKKGMWREKNCYERGGSMGHERKFGSQKCNVKRQD